MCWADSPLPPARFPSFPSATRSYEDVNVLWPQRRPVLVCSPFTAPHTAMRRLSAAALVQHGLSDDLSDIPDQSMLDHLRKLAICDSLNGTVRQPSAAAS